MNADQVHPVTDSGAAPGGDDTGGSQRSRLADVAATLPLAAFLIGVLLFVLYLLWAAFWGLPRTLFEANDDDALSVLSSGTSIRSLAFHPDAAVLASGHVDGAVRLWDLSDPASPAVLGAPLTDHGQDVWTVGFHPDGTVLASGDYDGTVRIWDVSDATRPRPLAAFGGDPPVAGADDRSTTTVDDSSINALAFSRDGTTLVTDGNAGPARLWDVSDPTRPRPSGVLTEGTRLRLLAEPQPNRGEDFLAGYDEAVLSLAYSPDGTTLATAMWDGRARLWDVADPMHPRLVVDTLEHESTAVEWVAFSPDGSLLATNGMLWDVDDRTAPRPLGSIPRRPGSGYPYPSDPEGRVTAAAFSPDGTVMATADEDLDVEFWDISDPSEPRSVGGPLTGHDDTIESVAFSPDGTFAATTAADGSARLWSMPGR